MRFIDTTDWKRDLILWVTAATITVVFAFMLSHAQRQTPEEYPVLFGDGSRVYDGDTLMNMFVVIKKFENTDYPAETLFPGVFLKGDTLYVVKDVRLFGIDTPERRPKKAGRTPESIEREKAAAQAATEALSLLLSTHDFECVLVSPQIGKYGGRVIGDILVGKERINLSDYLIERGLGYEYDGNTKKPFDEWYQER